MKPKKIWSNFTVSDLDRTTKFYTALGFKPNGRNNDLTSFLISEDNFIMHFFLKEVLKANVEIDISDAHIANEIIFTLSAECKAEVDQWAKDVVQAGGKIVSEPKAFGEGYYGFVFSDPDGHKFNVFYM
ncbi:glyoxalase [Pedobacter sp. Leaf216]|uniref:VOC family protein n=1 Tax=Pedobacter sp. Leaf216 TaxID=1735684 RepID=UPI0006F2D5CF|nr:VOC family protein [Pedobacter sp. Leaf216]KQM78127.1 glyoxalase [Pedobacter sp. Leaf216]